MPTEPPLLSVVVATYKRPRGIAALLQDMERQRLDDGDFEIVVVNDGSPDDTRGVLEAYSGSSSLADSGRLTVLHQANQGQAAARQAGVNVARGSILLFTDDDMRMPGNDFLEYHAKHHRGGRTAVVLGRMEPPPDRGPGSPYEEHFERTLEHLYNGFAVGSIRPGGQHFFTGNVSLPRELFREVGGFNRAFKSVEDKELGLRIERTGRAMFEFEPDALCYHYSDRNTFRSFAGRAKANGEFDWKILQMYPERLDCSPAAMLATGGVVGRAVKRWLRGSRWLRTALLAGTRPALTFGPRAGSRAACSLLYNAAYISGVVEAAGQKALAKHLADYKALLRERLHERTHEIG
jgi:glycosyltransferase involved in cell wall biosynthesis